MVRLCEVLNVSLRLPTFCSWKLIFNTHYRLSFLVFFLCFVYRASDECTCAHLQHQRHQRHHVNHPAHHRKSSTSPIHHSHPPPSSSPCGPPPAPTSSPSSSPMTGACGGSGHAQTHHAHPPHHHKLTHQHTTGQLPNPARPAMKRRPFKKAYSIDVQDIYNMPTQPTPPGSDIAE